MANAPSRGGSISQRSAAPSAFSSSAVISNRLRSAKRVLSARRFAAAAARARSTSAALPSRPSTEAARVASGKVKLPRPQNQSITESPGSGASRLIARDTSVWLMSRLTCVKSVALNGMRMPNSGSVYSSVDSARVEPMRPCRGLSAAATTRRRASRRTLAGVRGRLPKAARGGAARARSPRRRRPARSAASGRARPSPRPARATARSMSLTRRGSTSQLRMSATKLDLRS